MQLYAAYGTVQYCVHGMVLMYMRALQRLHTIYTSDATGSGHSDYLGHLHGSLFVQDKVVLGHAYMPDPDQNYLVIMYIKNYNEKMDTLQ